MARRAFNTILLLSALALPLHAAVDRLAPSSQGGPAGPQPATTTPFPAHLLEGRGAPHAEYQDCVAGLPLLAKSLAARGFKLTESATCSFIDGQTGNYAPTFRAWSDQRYEFKQILGGIYNTSSVCDSVAEKMRLELAHTEMVLEVGCAVTSGATQMGPMDLAYQPVAVVIAIP